MAGYGEFIVHDNENIKIKYNLEQWIGSVVYAVWKAGMEDYCRRLPNNGKNKYVVK